MKPLSSSSEIRFQWLLLFQWEYLFNEWCNFITNTLLKNTWDLFSTTTWKVRWNHNLKLQSANWVSPRAVNVNKVCWCIETLEVLGQIVLISVSSNKIISSYYSALPSETIGKHAISELGEGWFTIKQIHRLVNSMFDRDISNKDWLSLAPSLNEVLNLRIH